MIDIPNWMKLNPVPDLILPDYLNRWWVLPRNPWFNIYLHQFIGGDDDRASHDHPWWSVSFNLKGRLLEEIHQHTEEETWVSKQYRRIKWLVPYFRSAEHSHIMHLKTKTAWTLFITGPRRRDWGFWTRAWAGNLYKYQVSRWMSHDHFLKTHGSYDRQED